jgi:endonuclease G
MVAANHLDHNDLTIKESMYMTNIMPQTVILNRQAYLVAEEIFECWRDIVNLNTIVGIIMGDNVANDYFVNSHGVRTPDYYWRIIEKEIDGDVIAWIFVIFFNDFLSI